jgi:polysaccharide export outer membrane protein
LALSLMLALAACSAPRGAGFQSEVLAAADDQVEGAVPEFQVVPVTRDTQGTLADWPWVGPRSYDWIRRQPQTPSMIIAPGDTVSVTVWDTEENSLLAGPGSRVAHLEDVQVSSGGSIFLPFVGDMRVSGMSIAGARERIEERYAETIPSAQVQISVEPGRANTANLVGGVTNPGIYPLVDRDMTLLTLISQGGGVRGDMVNPQVRLFRGSEIYGTSLARLYDDPSLDTTLVGGDRVIIEEEERFFLSLGAAGSEAMHLFPGDQLTAIQALSIIGGVSDTRADPQGVLVLREYPRSALDRRPGPDQTRVVFTIDLTSADGLFSARNFAIMPGDLVYATESPVTTAQTILGLLGSVIGVTNRIR